MKPLTKKLILLVVLILLCACQQKNVLPCPISQEQMVEPAQDAVPFTIVNQSCTTFSEINVSPCTCDDWGFDWLGADTLRTGESLTIMLPAGKYDVELGDATDLSYTFERQKVDGQYELWVYDAGAKQETNCTASITIQNNSAVAITRVYFGLDHSDYLGDNWLGQDQIAPGEAAQFFVFPDTYDIVAEDENANRLFAQMDVLVEAHIVLAVP